MTGHVVSPEPWGPVISPSVSLVGFPHNTTVFIIIQFIVLNYYKCTCHIFYQLTASYVFVILAVWEIPTKNFINTLAAGNIFN